MCIDVLSCALLGVLVEEGYYAAECIRRSSMCSNIDMSIAYMGWEVLVNPT